MACLTSSISTMNNMWMAESREATPNTNMMDHETMHPMMRMFLKNYNEPNHPYKYMDDPMASVPLVRVPVSKATPYNHHIKAVPYNHHQMNNFQHQKMPYSHMSHQEHKFKELLPYMLGEEYFKHQNGDVINFINEEEDDDEYEQLPYEVIQDYGSYEKRKIPSATYACVQDKVDTAADPLAGLRINGLKEAMEVMRSSRWQKLPSSKMFKELFKYISGVNERAEEINMTRPVTTLHHVERRDYLGNVEIQEMCFYLPEKYQPNHKHDEEAGPSPRHAELEAPKPLNQSKVFIHTRPELEVYVRAFGGYAMTQDDWEIQRQTLEDDLAGKPHHDNEFFTVGYNGPFKLFNRRNEVWIQCAEPGHPVVEAVVATGFFDDHDHQDDNDLPGHPSSQKRSQVIPKKEKEHKVVKKNQKS